MKSLYEREFNSRVFNRSLRAHPYASDDGVASLIRCSSLQLSILSSPSTQNDNQSLSLTMYVEECK